MIAVVAVLALTPGGQTFIAPLAGSLNGATAGLIGIKAATGAVIGGIAGGLSPALAGGDLSDILKGALIGGIQGGITAGALHAWEPQVAGFNLETARHVVGHGVVGGSANYAMGGKFQDGFLSAAVSAAASNAGLLGKAGGELSGAERRTITAAAIGGTASALGGGKFANGAATAAFQHLLNAETGRSSDTNQLSRGERVNSLVRGASLVGELIGRVWSLPNTIIGFLYGSLSLPFGASLHFVDGVMQFRNMPSGLMGSAMSLGDVNLFGVGHPPSSDNNMGLGVSVGMEERLHSIQARILGPLYLPAHIAAGTISSLTPLGLARFPFVDPWHRNNFMETGPMQGAVFRDRGFYQR